MTMRVSFKVSKKGARFRPKPKTETPTILEDDDVDAPPEIPKNQSVSATPRPSIDVTDDREDDDRISDADISFVINLFQYGYSIGNPCENGIGHQAAVQDDPKFLHPYDWTSESLFLAIERGLLPADFLDDILCKYTNGAVVCELRDYRNCAFEPGVNGSSADASPATTKIRLRMSLENVVKDIPLIADSSWTYGDLMEAEARILRALQPKLNLDPTPNLERLCKDPTSLNLNLNIPDLRRKRLRLMSGGATASDNQVQGKKVCMDQIPESSNCRLGDSGQLLQQPDHVNLNTQNVGPGNMLASGARTYSADTSIQASPSVSYQSKYQLGAGNPRLMQDHGPGPVFSVPGASPGQDMMNSYADSMNSNISSVHAKSENQDIQLSPIASLNKRARSNSMGVDASQQQQMVASHMDGFTAPDSHWKNSLIQQQSVGRGIQLPNAVIQKYPQQLFEGGFNQEAGAMPFTMGQPGMRYNLKQEPVETERSGKFEVNRNKSEVHLVDSDINHADPQQSRLQQRFPHQFTRSNFPPTPWNSLGQSLENNSRKEEQLQRRKSAQSPRVSAGALPQSPLSSKSGESGSFGAQFGVAATTAALGSSQREKPAVTSVPTVGGTGSLTSSANDSIQRQHQAQMAARRSNSLPKTPAMSGVGSPASVSNISGPLNASSPLVGKEADKSIRDRFSKIEMLTGRYKLNCKKNKVDEYKKTTAFPTQQLNHHLFNDHNNDNSKDEACKMPLSKSLVGGSMNVCKTRVLNFVQTERVLQGSGFSLVPKSRTRMILSAKPDDGTVAMHYGELDDCDYLSAEESLPTLPNTNFADLLAAQFCSLISREGYHVEGDHLQPKPINTFRLSGGQPNNASGVSPNSEMHQIPETVSGQPSNEVVKLSDSRTNNAPANSSQNMPGSRMHAPVNSQALQISQGGLLPGVSMPPSRPQQSELQPSFQQQQQQNQHSLMQQQLQRSPAMMLASNPLSHLNAMGQNSNMQQLGHMLNKASPLPLQILQQQHQQPQMQRKMMMSLGNVGMGGSTGNNMVGLQGMGNVMGMGGARGGTGISPPMTGPISGMRNNMGQNPINMSQASSIGNVISQQLRSGLISADQAAIMTMKLKMAQNRNVLGGAGVQSGNISGLPGANRQMHPGSSSYSMLGPSINRANNMNPMQRTAMAPPRLMPGMNLYMNQQQQQQLPHHQQQQQQQQESTSPLQAVLSPPQQVGSPSMGLPQQQQASPQQMSQRTPMSPQLSSGAIHPPMSAGNQEGTGPASPQLSSQTLGSVSSMTNSPMELQGVNKSS